MYINFLEKKDLNSIKYIIQSMTLEDKFDKLSEDIKNLTIKLECHLTEFRLFKKIGYAMLVGIVGILLKLFWIYVAKSPRVIANIIFNGTIS